MDTKEAIERLKNYEKTLFTASGKLALSIELEMAIEALEKLPVLEAENARLREKETPKEYGQVFWNSDRWSIMCPSCGAEIDDDSDFCKWCGQAIKNKE